MLRWLQFSGNGSTLSVKRSRLVKLRGAIKGFLSQPRVTGRMMRVLLGHITWAMLLRRPSLTLLSACYAFTVDSGGEVPRTAWTSVRRELGQIAATLPLLRCSLAAPFFQKVICSDASPFGLGVCSAWVPANEVAAAALQAERHRFHSDSAVRARENALGKQMPAPMN